MMNILGSSYIPVIPLLQIGGGPHDLDLQPGSELNMRSGFSTEAHTAI